MLRKLYNSTTFLVGLMIGLIVLYMIIREPILISLCLYPAYRMGQLSFKVVCEECGDSLVESKEN